MLLTMFALMLTLTALAADCPPTVTGADLARRYPAMIGEEVRLNAAIERSVDITTALVVADGKHFAVLLVPDSIWEGQALKTFAVMGSTTLPLAGSTSLPHLMLVTEPRCTADRKGHKQ